MRASGLCCAVLVFQSLAVLLLGLKGAEFLVLSFPVAPMLTACFSLQQLPLLVRLD
eukprot:m.320457 g.320457  ORF g.320457 m.320457 type:complete len:56 (+) comp67581_c0_seq1:138-305(+)